MNNAPSNVINLTPEISNAFAPEVLDVIRNTLAKGATDPEFLLFAHKAASYGLDPFKSEIFFIKYGTTAQIQFAAEAYLSKAREKEGFQAPEVQMVHENDEFKVELNKETKEMEIVQHEITFPRGEIMAAYCIAYRDGYRPVSVFMGLSEVEHLLKGPNKDMWNKYRSDMFGKHVQKRALKKQYGLEFDDVTIPTDNVPLPPRDITPKPKPIETQPAPAPEQESVQEVVQEDPETKRLLDEVGKKFKKLGITKRVAWLKENAPELDPVNASKAELESLIKLLDMNIEREEANAAQDDELL